jgi:heterodisulfide reductase subunit A
MARIGVFVCSCGRNIAGTVDVEAVATALAGHPGVVHSCGYTYMCSDPGQGMLQEMIREQQLTGVLVAACSPQLHEKTFRTAVVGAGLNPYLCEMANIREHCSWVHADRGPATAKAIELSRISIEKLKLNRPLQPIRIPVTRRALVIGGGIAGIQVALDVSKSGYEVIVVEKKPFIGGRMAQLAAVFPSMESTRYLLRPKIAQLLADRRVRLLTNSELVELSGYVGNFKARIRRRPAPAGLKSDSLLQDVFPLGMINMPETETTVEVEVGAVIPALGHSLYPLQQIAEYGAGKYDNVITSFQFEQLLRACEGRELRRPSDGKIPKEVVFIQCVRSRDRERGMPYCSRICCMYTAKQAMLFKQRVPDGQAYIFYIDTRVHGKEHEEFIQRASEEYGVMYLRGRVSRIFPQGDQIMVWGADTLSGRNVEIPADAVVLATAMLPGKDVVSQAKLLGISFDDHGFLNEAHPKLRPVETATAGIFLAGTCQAPLDIAGTVAHASGAASKVLELFSSRELERDPEMARVDESRCVGCLACAEVCPMRAITSGEIRDRDGNLVRTVAAVNEGLCQGCGLCTATCRSGSIDIEGCTEEQVFAEIEAFGMRPPSPDITVAAGGG